MVSVELVKRYPGFTLDARWGARGGGRGGRPFPPRPGGGPAPAAAGAARRVRLPGLRAVPAPQRRRERRLRAARPAARRARAPRRGGGRGAAARGGARGPAWPTAPGLWVRGEPLSALDAPLRRALRDELRELLAAWG